MPYYEYKCSKCGILEIEQKIIDDPLKRCPFCRKKIKRLISKTSFKLKGKGWYADGYSQPKEA